MRTGKSIGSAALSLTLILCASAGLAQTEWEKYPGNPVFDVEPSGAWDGAGAISGPILFNGTEYKMWYTGYPSHSDGMWRVGLATSRVGLATSPDGITWTKYPNNPVLSEGQPGSWEENNIHAGTVLFDGTEYKMWYGAKQRSITYAWIGYATSPDGIVWTKYPDNPVLSPGPGGAFDDYRVEGANVLFDGYEYKMWYSAKDGSNYRIGFATSPDGVTWTKHPGNPVLDLGPSGTWDDEFTFTPNTLFDGAEYKMWYSGNYGSGYATSSDGIEWTKYEGNPVFDLGPSGAWDDAEARSPIVLFDGDAYKMWYSGYDGSSYRIGYAISLLDCWDDDGDGFWDAACGGTDCDGSDPAINPGAEEICDDLVDNDCDGLIDTDPECISISVPDEQSTIQDAINAAESGNTILVAPGIYQENIDFMGKDVKVHSVEGPSKTIIDGGQAGSVVSIASGETEGAVLDGFTLQNGNGTFITIPYVGAGFYAGGGIFCEGSSPTITNCKIANNYAYFGGGIYLRASAPTITNCMIVKNWATGIIHGGGGIYLENSSPTITNCTVSTNFANQYGGGIFCWNSSPTITNSILWSDYSIFDSEIHVRSGSPVVTWSDVEGGWPGEGNIEENPFFIGTGNYHLRLISPCIDAGTDADIYTDMDGQSRPWGAGFDMGADEFSTESCSVIASSGTQFFAIYLIPVLALIILTRQGDRRSPLRRLGRAR